MGAATILTRNLDDTAQPRQSALRRDRGRTLAGPEYTYDHWIDSLGLPLYTGFYIEDLRTLELAWWEQRQCSAAFVKLMGQEGVCEARVTEIPPGKTLPPLKMAVDEIVYVVEGNGLASVWAGDGPRKPFEWQKFSMFMLPRHCWSQLSNMQGDKPARLLHYNFLPLAMTTIPDPDFFINNAHESPQRLYGREEFYSQAKITTEEAGIFKLVKPTDVLWSGNFFPDMRAWDKFTPFWGRGAGGQTIFVHFPDSEMDIHMSIFSEGTYKKAHRHGPGRVIVIPAGEGYSIMWEEGKEKIVVPWHEASMFVPPRPVVPPTLQHRRRPGPVPGPPPPVAVFRLRGRKGQRPQAGPDRIPPRGALDPPEVRGRAGQQGNEVRHAPGSL